MTSLRLIMVLGIAAISLSACGSVRESLGLGRNPPDEFAVADRPPLSMPPDFGLRAPQPGAPRPQDINLSKRASDALFGPDGKVVDTTDLSPAEKALLETTGAAKADPNIREVVDREAAEKVVGSEHLIDEILWWREPPKPGTVVDPVKEAERIKEAKDKGEALTKTATPIIEKKKTGWLGL
ncbi:MAG: DUF3035 domain-containing protein [Alphaproteobacteria bacterium]